MANVPPVHFSHFGIFVFDLAKMEEFYTSVLGFIPTDRGIIREVQDLVFLSRDPNEHHQIVLCSGRTVPIGEKLINQISLRVDSIDDLRTMNASIAKHPEVSEINPINHVVAFSVYFADPEGNRVEIFCDTPWYTDQPHVEPLELEKSNEDLLAATELKYKDDPSFQPLAQWRANFKERLAHAQK